MATFLYNVTFTVPMEKEVETREASFCKKGKLSREEMEKYLRDVTTEKGINLIDFNSQTLNELPT